MPNLTLELSDPPNPHRGQGHGAKLMIAIETYAAKHAHSLIYLETTSFQALPFYEGLGYQIFGELPEIAAGHARANSKTCKLAFTECFLITRFLFGMFPPSNWLALDASKHRLRKGQELLF